MSVCFSCGGTIIEYDAAAGNGFCVQCGTVVEENTIVSEVTFGETSNGAAMVQGSYIAQGATRARMGGIYGNRSTGESREQTIANASRRIQNIATVLRLSEVICHAATRLYTLAVEHRFTKGRRSMNVVAVCLYIACRQKETRNYMLIDFSDLLQVNVFELGHTYLQLVQTLNLRLPLVDPSHYISRFSALLEFGEDTARVASDAVRLVQRFDRDWLARGRRPAGICGAALLLAARMNGFRRSVAEIVQVVKIADTTLKKRLEEFKKTPSAQLKLADFRTVWLEDEMDPPAYTRGREKEGHTITEMDSLEAEKEGGKKRGGIDRKKKTRKRKREEPAEFAATATKQPRGSNIQSLVPDRPNYDHSLFTQGILEGTSEELPLFLPDSDTAKDLSDAATLDNTDANIDPELLRLQPLPPAIASEPVIAESSETQLSRVEPSLLHDEHPESATGDKDEESTPVGNHLDNDLDDKTNEAIADEVNMFLANDQGTQVAGAIDESDQRRRARAAELDQSWAEGLNEEELEQFILTEDEVKIKERVWVELNKDYLEAIAARGDIQGSSMERPKSRKRQKTNQKPRDSTDPTGSTAAESVRTLLKKNPKYSKRINYDALKGLFEDDVRDENDKDDGAVYRLSDHDKSDGDMAVVDEDAGDTPVAISRVPRNHPSEKVVPGDDFEDDDMGSDKGEDYVAWEDTFEQEAF